MSQIWVTSDWHFCHSQPFLYEPRGFKNQYEMNAAIIERHNTIVQADDEVYVLGDCILNDNEEGIKCIKQLKGQIHIIRGNHCTDARIELYKTCPNVVEVCDAKWLKIGKQSFFLSHYPCLTDNHDDDKPLNRKIISLCGHTHTPDKWHDWNNGLIYHVEMDAHGCQVVNIEQIISDIQNKITGQEL